MFCTERTDTGVVPKDVPLCLVHLVYIKQTISIESSAMHFVFDFDCTLTTRYMYCCLGFGDEYLGDLRGQDKTH